MSGRLGRVTLGGNFFVASMPSLLSMAISLMACRPAGRLEHIGRAGQSSSVFLKGRPRSPLKSLRRRLSLELLGRRMIFGATR